MKKNFIYLLIIFFCLILCSSCGSSTDEEDEYDIDSEIRSYFIDEVYNFAKAAETKYVYDSIETSIENPCYTVDELLGDYINKSDNYSGKIILEIDEDSYNIKKYVTITDGKNFYVDNIEVKNVENNVQKFDVNKWNSIKNNSTCISN